MPLGLVLGLGAALAWGLTDVCATFGGRRLGSLRVLAASQVVGFALLGILGLARGELIPGDPGATLAAVLVGVAGTGAYLSFFTALRIGPLAVVSPIAAAYGGLTVVLAVVLTGERLTSFQAVGAGVATAGVVLAGLVFDGGIRHARIVGRGVGFAVVALVLFAVMTMASAGPVRIAGWLPVIFVARLTSAAISIALLAVATARPASLAPLLEAPQTAAPSAWWLAAAAGLLDAAGLVSFAIGLEQSETWLVGLASSFGPAVAVLGAVLLLGERLRPTQWLGLAGIAIGLVAVAIG
ncbi:MAG TPA: DMT family transporter [Candidatus Limnocylindrales bacterium]|nr:DMT family transporter [Candidatus Limnocylindrales bacterium]